MPVRADAEILLAVSRVIDRIERHPLPETMRLPFPPEMLLAQRQLLLKIISVLLGRMDYLAGFTGAEIASAPIDALVWLVHPDQDLMALVRQPA